MLSTLSLGGVVEGRQVKELLTNYYLVTYSDQQTITKEKKEKKKHWKISVQKDTQIKTSKQKQSPNNFINNNFLNHKPT